MSEVSGPLLVQEVIKRDIEQIISTIVEDVGRGRAPYFEIRKPSNNYRLQKIELHSKSGGPLFTAVLSLMVKSHELISTNMIQNKRDIFYENLSFYRDQSKLDRAIMILTCILKVPRWDLNIEASGKGLIAGALKWRDAMNEFCEIKPNVPTLIPTRQVGFHAFESEAKYIIIVEKDAIFKKIMEEKCFEVLDPFLLATGKGYPDYATRRFIRKVSDSLGIPAFILVDADPHGLDIAASYRWGSKDSFDPELCIPTLKMIGVLPSELAFLSSPQQSLTLAENEVKRLDALEKRIPDQDWKQEVEVLRTTKRKAEIEHLTNSSPNYLTQVYLKSKIARFMAPNIQSH